MTSLIAAPLEHSSVHFMLAVILVLVGLAVYASIRVILRGRPRRVTPAPVKPGDLTIYQGTFSRGQASAGTHSGAGAVDMPWEPTKKWLDDIEAWQENFHERIRNQLAAGGNRVIGFDHEGTPVYESDIWDGNIDPDDVIRVGGVYYQPKEHHG